jgi:hypothetical protein
VADDQNDAIDPEPKCHPFARTCAEAPLNSQL